MHLLKSPNIVLYNPWHPRPWTFKAGLPFWKSTSAFYLTLWDLHMVHPWLQGSFVLSWLNQKSGMSIKASKMCQCSVALGLPLHCGWHYSLMLCSLCPSSHDCFCFLSQGGKPSVNKKVLPQPSFSICVFCSEMPYWSESGSLEHCFQTADAEATWKRNGETRMIIIVTKHFCRPNQAGATGWPRHGWGAEIVSRLRSLLM